MNKIKKWKQEIIRLCYDISSEISLLEKEKNTIERENLMVSYIIINSMLLETLRSIVEETKQESNEES